jgi:hypothetical protein
MIGAALGTAIVGGVVQLVQSWFDTKIAKNESEATLHQTMANNSHDWDMLAMLMSKTSWKDELITLIVFGPLIVAFFPVFARPMIEWQVGVMQWVTFINQLPAWYIALMFGITAASFGLRWFFTQNRIKITSKGVTVGEKDDS